MTGTFNETYFEFDAEIERLDEKIDELGKQLQETESEDHAKVLSNRRQKLKSYRQGVIWARDRAAESDDFPMWDEAVDGVTLGGLRAQTYGRMHDDISGDSDAGPGSVRTLYVADGTVEAPYVDADMSENERTAAVGQLHPMYLMWAEDRINALMDPEGNVTSSGTSPGESGQTPAED